MRPRLSRPFMAAARPARERASAASCKDRNEEKECEEPHLRPRDARPCHKRIRKRTDTGASRKGVRRLEKHGAHIAVCRKGRSWTWTARMCTKDVCRAGSK